MAASDRLERHARRLAAATPTGNTGAFERAALRLAGSHLTRRQAIGAAAAGSLALAAGAPRPARAQLAQCPPPQFPNDTKVCPYTCPGFAPNWICCRADQVCCTEQPAINGMGGSCAVGCCEPGQTCCYSPSFGAWGCCGCPRGLHECGAEPFGTQCCQRDEVCDVVDFVCRPGDQCPNVVCDGACCEPGEVCAGGNCCQAAKGCGGICCGRGMICTNNTCKQLVDYKRPPRQRQRKNNTIDTPRLETFDADVAAEANYRASTPGGSSADSSAGFLVGRRRVRLRAHTTRTVAVKLTRRARRHLGRGRPLPAQLTLTFRDSAGGKITEAHRVTILPRRRP